MIIFDMGYQVIYLVELIPVRERLLEFVAGLEKKSIQLSIILIPGIHLKIFQFQTGLVLLIYAP
ncbi:hypothetical protein NMYAN_20331 [Nitrosomonas nitrosa]|uniref:Uncharacterized protein n=1 Tax=Nitrosomonas nitrosa TaxID=52442 RepID=A0A8H8Z184_9PROT|nr:hypothetical protein NMYAN_20331 [Nitrosomonas nitrosa]